MNKDDVREVIKSVIVNNDLDYNLQRSNTIIVIRNTDMKTGNYVADTGENATDTVYLSGMPYDMPDLIMTGRSIINKRYIDKIYADGIKDKSENFNKIAPCFRESAYRRGYHRGKEALVQNRALPLIRTVDRAFGNEDDYIEVDIVADNFHGWLASMGCITVAGKMYKSGGTRDWSAAHNWAYKTSRNSFDFLMLEHSDFINSGRKALRFGSAGNNVKDLQGLLGIKIDGFFGEVTLHHLVELQKKNNIEDFGIFEI